MSLTDFSQRARLDIQITVEGSGQFSPFPESYGVPMNWTLGGSVQAKTFTEELTVREQTCGVPYGSNKEFRFFSLLGSTGNTSGTIDLGQFAPNRSAEAAQGRPLGTWKVNTSPVLSANANADGDPVTSGYYIVEKPDNKTIDEPITISPAIDALTRVYPGDIVYVSGTGASAQWRAFPQVRFPKSDRTFFWTPNTAPIVKSGGIVADKLAKPGTIMLPTANYYIEPPTNAIDGMRYFYEGQGIMFDGYTWVKNTQDPYIYEPEEGPKEFWPQNLAYVSPQQYERLFENDHRIKPFIATNQTIDDENPVVFTVTPEGGGDPEVTDMLFRWGNPMNGAEANIQPGQYGFYDFGDAWSKHHMATRSWLNQRFPGYFSAGCSLTSVGEPPLVISLGVSEFADGNVTETQETVTVGGEELVNTFKITLSVTPGFAP